MTETRYVYNFGANEADGSAAMKKLLGGKGANLAEMTRLGLPVPPGFTVSTAACLAYLAEHQRFPDGLEDEALEALALLESRMGLRFGDASGPLLVSVRSGAAISMPGMMDTVLNLGLNDETVAGLGELTGNPRFAWDSYRRFIQMYANVVMGLRTDILEQYLERAKDIEDCLLDSELSVDALKNLVADYKQTVLDLSGTAFPQDPREQLWNAIAAVFRSWNTRRAVDYRNSEGIAHDLGTAVNVQAMVFGNMGEDSATGVAFTRDPKTGQQRFFGEWLPNAQGEDVVAGVRTPQPINLASGALSDDVTLEAAMPKVYEELVRLYHVLERHYRDMQDIEFTIQQGRLWMLQTRTGKRSPRAEVRIAVDMANEGLITRNEAILRVRTETIERLLHPQIDPSAERAVIATGLGASPGAATGKVVFFADDAVERAGRGEAVILVRRETSPEDIHGMLSARGILTARGGMTSHAAVVARGISKPCIVGAGEIDVDSVARTMTCGDVVVHEGDILTLDGGDGSVMLGEMPTIQPEPTADLHELMGWVDAVRRLKVYTNADTPRDCQIARDFGAEGIGLCRTEHMFFDEERIMAVREMILADDEQGRRRALEKILPMQRGDFRGIYKVMDGLPVIIRLLDPPLHEFLPQTEREIAALAEELGVDAEELDARNRALHEVNPMLGHRGCRLGLTFPEIYEMQVRAILEAAVEAVREDGVAVKPLIMIPLVGHVRELAFLREVVDATARRVLAEGETDVPYQVGTMIELPRACLTADEIAAEADFFSFGTNDLTQTTFGISRDDCPRFLPLYVDVGILPIDPFVSLDSAVCELVRMATEKGRAVKPGLSIGICGEHGGEPRSVAFCHSVGLDYVSCSPPRIPVARLAAAHAALAEAS
ncbi:MAG: pyruvate, phosphate dikinase [Deltaproteobacteria bacterium]|nr:pyruvate, phosphate dikinase [Deltaproteobacteria bacterium]MCB9787307.1 pyruvate, phosphate dikinase [Deltaproteobacteria bacterium]